MEATERVHVSLFYVSRTCQFILCMHKDIYGNAKLGLALFQPEDPAAED